jgi:hypothetical protein
MRYKRKGRVSRKHEMEKETTEVKTRQGKNKKKCSWGIEQKRRNRRTWQGNEGYKKMVTKQNRRI